MTITMQTVINMGNGIITENMYSRVPNRQHGVKQITGLENIIDIGGRVKEMCPKHKGHRYSLWLFAQENL